MAPLLLIAGLVAVGVFWVVLRRPRRHAAATPGGARVELRAPRHWVAAHAPGCTLSLEDRRSGNMLLVTVLPVATGPGTASRVRQMAERTRDDVRRSAVEREIPLLRMATAAVEGYYFSSTDAALKPGGFPFMTAGVLDVQGLVVSFTVLLRVAPPDGAAEALSILSGISATPPAKARAAAAATGGRPPSRVAAVRAGWIFTPFWQFASSGDPQYQLSPGERNGLVAELQAIFVNPDFGLEQVVETYRAGRGSNEVLRAAMLDLPDHVFRWFRVGQTLMGHVGTADSEGERSFSLGELAVKGNLASAGVPGLEGDAVLRLVRELRELPQGPSKGARGADVIQRISATIDSLAARQDRYEEFERRAIDEGGVFISYSHEDRALVQRLTSRFDADGIHYWVDDREFRVGDVIDATLTQAIRDSCLFLVLLTPNSISSEWVKFEIQEAARGEAGGGKAILPVLAKGVTASAVPRVLGKDRLAVDIDSGFEAGYEKLRHAILAHLADFAAKATSRRAPA